MEYMVVEVIGDVNELVAKVNNHIKQGWKPLGGIAVDIPDTSEMAGSDDCFYQAMIKD